MFGFPKRLNTVITRRLHLMCVEEFAGFEGVYIKLEAPCIVG